MAEVVVVGGRKGARYTKHRYLKGRARTAQRQKRQRYGRVRLGRSLKGFVRTGGYYGIAATPGELKFHDLDVDDAAIASGGTIAQASCNLIAQGVTESTRIGRKCTVRSIGWRFQIVLATAASTGTRDSCRVILYLDKQCNGATAAVTDIVESADFQSFNNLANKSRFRTLMDRTYTLNPSGGAGDGTTNDSCTTSVDDTFFKKCRIPLEFDSTTGAITEIRSNNIGVLLLADVGNLGFESKMRLRFEG